MAVEPDERRLRLLRDEPRDRFGRISVEDRHATIAREPLPRLFEQRWLELDGRYRIAVTQHVHRCVAEVGPGLDENPVAAFAREPAEEALLRELVRGNHVACVPVTE